MAPANPATALQGLRAFRGPNKSKFAGTAKI